MCLIYQKQRPVSVTDIGNGPDIAAHTIIGWTYQKNSLTIRILSESLFHSLRIQIDGVLILLLPFPVREKKSGEKQEKSKVKLTKVSLAAVLIGFTSSSTFMLWLNCNQELGRL